MPFPTRATALASIAGATMASICSYPFLPKRVPTHFDADGNPIGTSPRAAAAFSGPAVEAALWLLNRTIGGWPGEGDREDAAQAADERNEGVAVVMLTISLVHLAILARAAGLPVDMDRTGRGVLGATMIVIGNLMPRWPRSSLIGIRTPWTLADPRVWERTHRLGGYLFTAAGLISLASLVSIRPWARRAPLVALPVAVIVASAYSYFEWSRLRK